MDWREHIVITPGVRSGKPRLKGTRLTVRDVMEYLAGGDTPESLQEAFPELTPERLLRLLRRARTHDERQRVTLLLDHNLSWAQDPYLR